MSTVAETPEEAVTVEGTELEGVELEGALVKEAEIKTDHNDNTIMFLSIARLGQKRDLGSNLDVC